MATRRSNEAKFCATQTSKFPEYVETQPAKGVLVHGSYSMAGRVWLNFIILLGGANRA